MDCEASGDSTAPSTLPPLTPVPVAVSSLLMSTFHSAEPAATVKRRTLDRSQTDVCCPPLLVDYQQYMRGVDVGDQMTGYYNIGRRSKKWWKRVFSYLVECSILNSYVLDSHVHASDHLARGHRKRDFLAFRLELAKELVGCYCSRQRLGRPRSVGHECLKRLNISLGHWSKPIKKARRCVVCIATGSKLGVANRHETKFVCRCCDVPLCLTERDCFFKYHTKVDYTI